MPLRAPRIPRRSRPPARPVAGHPRSRLLLRLAQAGDPRPHLGRDRYGRRRHPALAGPLEDAGRADAPDLAGNGKQKRDLHQPTVDYVARRTAGGRNRREIIRCLKRFLAREIYQRVMADFRMRRHVTQAA